MTPPSSVTNTDHRLTQMELRMDKYDQILAGILRSQDRYDLMLDTFMKEMKELKARDIDLSSLIHTHERAIDEHSQHWKTTMTVAKWIVGVLSSLTLLFLGTLLNHLVK